MTEPGPAACRLAAILFADIVGYTAAMAQSEARGLRLRQGSRLQEPARRIRLPEGTPTL